MGVWKRTPPPHVVLLSIAGSLGIDFSGDNNQADNVPPDLAPPGQAIEPVGGMSIRELSIAIKQPVAGGDTLQASLQALKMMNS